MGMPSFPRLTGPRYRRATDICKSGATAENWDGGVGFPHNFGGEKMQAEEMRRIVSEELSRIPEEPKLNQSLLRMVYAARRKRSLGRNGDGTKGPRDVMRDAIASVRITEPSATFVYDRVFFGEQN